MSAIVLNMSDFRTVFSPESEARDQVARQIDHRVTVRILAQAQERAARHVRNGIHPNVAAARAVSWALCAIHPDTTEAA